MIWETMTSNIPMFEMSTKKGSERAEYARVEEKHVQNH